MSDGALNIAVGVGGGIAAYKVPSLIRLFTEAGHSVQPVPTDNALKFVGAATLEALSGHPVSSSVFDGIDQVRHVRVGHEADLVVVAPATADLLARMAAGRADDLLTATLLVATCPVVVAPAMHTQMWQHPATRENVATLRRRGIIVLEPAVGRLTGRDSGPGRMLEPTQIATLALMAASRPESLVRDLEGCRVVISAGGTREPLDPVRYIGNRSSGRQGFALAEVAVHRGAEVQLIAGAVEDLPTPAGATVTRVETTAELEAAVTTAAADADVVIMAAAVADFRPDAVATAKVKKGPGSSLSTVNLVENPDILAGVVSRRTAGQTPQGQIIVGFAAETGDSHGTPLEYARVKRAKKGCDLLLCNVVGEGLAFGTPDNAGWILDRDGREVEIPRAAKESVAALLLDRVVAFRDRRRTDGPGEVAATDRLV